MIEWCVIAILLLIFILIFYKKNRVTRSMYSKFKRTSQVIKENCHKRMDGSKKGSNIPRSTESVLSSCKMTNFPNNNDIEDVSFNVENNYDIEDQ